MSALTALLGLAVALNTPFNQKEEDVGRISEPRDAKHLFIDHFFSFHKSSIAFFSFLVFLFIFKRSGCVGFLLPSGALQCVADVSPSVVVQQKLKPGWNTTVSH